MSTLNELLDRQTELEIEISDTMMEIESLRSSLVHLEAELDEVNGEIDTFADDDLDEEEGE